MIFVKKDSLKNLNNVKRVLKLSLPSQNAVTNSSLNPTLGQHGINSFEFNKKFNELTVSIKKDVMVRLLLVLYLDKTFDLFLVGISTGFLINEYLQYLNIKEINTKKIIKLSVVYNLSRLIVVLNYKNNITIKSVLLQLFGVLKSMKVEIVNDLV